MADTTVQLEVENWVRDNWMCEQFGQRFHHGRLKLSGGGEFSFDAVSEDKSIAACILTSGFKTSSGKPGSGKRHKLRADMFFLLTAVGLKRKLLILTEPDMHEVCLGERKAVCVPPDIEFHLARIPDELHARLLKAKAIASREVTPVKIEQLPDDLLTPRV